MEWKVYLSGEIHSDWRNEIINEAQKSLLPIAFACPVTDHKASDNIGEEILGSETKVFWKDHKSAKINSIRVRKEIQESDLVIVKFGEEYRQWNAAFEAGYAAALGIPYIVIHPSNFSHALKEVDAQAAAVVETEEQALNILEYILSKE